MGAMMVSVVSACASDTMPMTAIVTAKTRFMTTSLTTAATRFASPGSRCCYRRIRRSSSLLQSRIERVAEGIAQDVGGHHDQENRDARNDRDVLGDEQKITPLRCHRAEFRGRRLRAQ